MGHAGTSHPSLSVHSNLLDWLLSIERLERVRQGRWIDLKVYLLHTYCSLNTVKIRLERHCTGVAASSWSPPFFFVFTHGITTRATTLCRSRGCFFFSARRPLFRQKGNQSGVCVAVTSDLLRVQPMDSGPYFLCGQFLKRSKQVFRWVLVLSRMPWWQG